MEEFKPALFTLGNEEYGIDITKVQGIENVESIVRVPSTAPYIKGIINLRNQVIPVYSLKIRFGLEDNNIPSDSQYLIVFTDSGNIALEVDNVEEIHNVSVDMVHEVPSIVRGGKTNYIDKLINIGKKLIVIIDVNNLLTEEEKKAVNDMISNLSE